MHRAGTDVLRKSRACVLGDLPVEGEVAARLPESRFAISLSADVLPAPAQALIFRSPPRMTASTTASCSTVALNERDL